MTPRQQTTLLVLGDCLVFIVFALIGLKNHEEGITANGIVRNAVPFGAAWLIAATFTGLYRPGWQHSDDGLLQKVGTAWLPAWALGLALRSLYVWHWPVAAFGGVVLITAGLMLVLWRTIAAWLVKQGQQQRSASS
jgi:hypothetical protein